MNIQTAWHGNDERIFVVTVIGRWTWRDIQPVLAELVQIDLQTPEPYDIVIDLRASTFYEPDIAGYLRSHASSRPPLINRRLLVFVGLDEYSRILWDGITKMPYAAHLKAHFSNTLEEALMFAKHYTG